MVFLFQAKAYIFFVSDDHPHAQVRGDCMLGLDTVAPTHQLLK